MISLSIHTDFHGRTVEYSWPTPNGKRLHKGIGMGSHNRTYKDDGICQSIEIPRNKSLQGTRN